MAKQTRGFMGKWALAFAVFSVLVLVNFVMAAHVVREQGDTDTVIGTQPLEDVTYFYNLSINNTDLGGTTANVTKVNITLPSGFSFGSSTNYTSTEASFSTDAAGNLIWQNTTYFLVNGSGNISVDSTQFFGFNATAATPGTFNISIYTTNATDTVGNNVTVTINDTTAATAASLVAPGLLANAKKSQTDFS